MERPIGAPCWIDLLTSDEPRAREFYAGVFGWTAGEGAEQFGGYFMFLRDGVPVAGCMRKVPGMPGGDEPDEWGVYLSSRDAKATVDRVIAGGGTLRIGPMDIADLGIEAILEDVPGARIGVWEAKAFPGITAFGEPAAPVWFRVVTSDYARSVAFYENAFGWQTRVAADTPQYRSTVLTAGGEDFAGIADASSGDLAGQPADRWEVYLRVADLDMALARVAELGGTVLKAAADTPFGRLAEVADPTGARFNLAG